MKDLLRADPDPATVIHHIGAQRSGPVAVVTLARPDAHNALGYASWRRIADVFNDFAEDDDLRAVVVRGAGDRAFGAGADIAEFPDRRFGAAAAVDYNEAIACALRAVTRVQAPVVAMLRGLAVGGGCELAAACDVRIAGRGARFGIPIGRLGVTLGYTEADALVRLIGHANLKYLLFSGRLIDADEALRMGLVQQVVDADHLAETTGELVDAILASSPVTMRAAKVVSDMCLRPLTAADTEYLARITVEAYAGPDLKEGVAAFTERRAPRFPGNSTKENRHGRA